MPARVPYMGLRRHRVLGHALAPSPPQFDAPRCVTRVSPVQAMIEGLGIMLQKSTAPPPSGMPPMDLPPAEAPKAPSEVLVGGGAPGGAPGGGELDSIVDDGAAAGGEAKKGRFMGLSLFGQGT